jgi:hypothetical protein
MKKLVAFVLAAAFSAQVQAAGEMTLLGVGAPVAVAGSYTGPGDVVSGASHWYGLRCYNAAKASLASAIRIRRASDNSEQDIGLTAGCDLDTSAASTFCAATSCFVVTAYDQVGSNNITNATAAEQPALTFNCVGGTKPCMTFDGGDRLASVSTVSSSQPVSYSVVARRTTFPSNYSTLMQIGNPGDINFAFGVSSGTMIMYAGALNSATATENAWHGFGPVANGTSGKIGVDGTVNTVNTGNGTLSGSTIYVGNNSSTSQPLTGTVAELGAWLSVGFSDTDIANLSSNQQSYWGY